MLASYIFLVLHVLFCVDIIISFRVAFHENEDLITDPVETARNYRRRGLAFQCTCRAWFRDISPCPCPLYLALMRAAMARQRVPSASNCPVDQAGRAWGWDTGQRAAMLREGAAHAAGQGSGGTWQHRCPTCTPCCLSGGTVIRGPQRCSAGPLSKPVLRSEFVRVAGRDFGGTWLHGSPSTT